MRSYSGVLLPLSAEIGYTVIVVNVCVDGVAVYKHAITHNMRTEDVTVEVRYVRRSVIVYISLTLHHISFLPLFCLVSYKLEDFTVVGGG